MTKSTFSFAGFVFLLFSGITVNAQMKVISTSSTPLDKDAVKGRFAGTYVMNDGSSELIYLSGSNVFGYKFNPSGDFSTSLTGSAVTADLDAMQLNGSSTGEMSKLPAYQGMDVVIGTTSKTGNLRLRTGNLYLSSSDKFIYGAEFTEKETIKPKAEDTWMTKFIGCRSYVPEKQFRLTDGHGKQVLYTLPEAGKYAVAPANGGQIQAAGIIIEKVSIKNPSPYNQNRIIVFTIPADDVNSMSENIINTPYSMQPMGAGITSFDGMAAMVMPLNAPSTYKPHKRLMAPDDKKTTLFVYRFDKNNQLVDSTQFASSSSVVNFQYLSEAETKTDIIFGFGNDKSTNWRWAFAGMELNVLQLVKLGPNGTIEFHKTYTEDEIASKLIVPGDKKNKIKLKFYNCPVWDYVKKLENGNFFFYGFVDGMNIALLADSKGDLVNVYAIPILDPEKNYRYGTQIEIHNGNVYLAVADQPKEFTNDVTKESFTTTFSGAYVSTSVTTTVTKQLFEIFHITQLIRIDGTTGEGQQLWLGDMGKEYYTMHNDPVVFADDAMYIAGRSKGPKGKEIFLTKVSY